jgi:hypothetical protein
MFNSLCESTEELSPLFLHLHSGVPQSGPNEIRASKRSISTRWMESGAEWLHTLHRDLLVDRALQPICKKVAEHFSAKKPERRAPDSPILSIYGTIVFIYGQFNNTVR